MERSRTRWSYSPSNGKSGRNACSPNQSQVYSSDLFFPLFCFGSLNHTPTINSLSLAALTIHTEHLTNQVYCIPPKPSLEAASQSQIIRCLPVESAKAMVGCLRIAVVGRRCLLTKTRTLSFCFALLGRGRENIIDGD